jgi:hypothetical protein
MVPRMMKRSFFHSFIKGTKPTQSLRAGAIFIEREIHEKCTDNVDVGLEQPLSRDLLR